MAIAAKFDLETRQLDAVKTFTNSLIDEDIESGPTYQIGRVR